MYIYIYVYIYMCYVYIYIYCHYIPRNAQYYLLVHWPRLNLYQFGTVLLGDWLIAPCTWWHFYWSPGDATIWEQLLETLSCAAHRCAAEKDPAMKWHSPRFFVNKETVWKPTNRGVETCNLNFVLNLFHFFLFFFVVWQQEFGDDPTPPFWAQMVAFFSARRQQCPGWTFGREGMSSPKSWRVPWHDWGACACLRCGVLIWTMAGWWGGGKSEHVGDWKWVLLCLLEWNQ